MAAPDFAAPKISTETTARASANEPVLAISFLLSIAHHVETFLDFATGAAAILACWLLLKAQPIHHDLSWRAIARMAILCGLMLSFLGYRERGHRRDCGLLRIRESETCLRHSVQTVIALIILCNICNLNIPALFLLIALVLVPIFLIAQKHASLSILQRWMQKEDLFDRAVVWGVGRAEKSFISTVLQSPRLGIRVLETIDHIPDRELGELNMLGYRGRASIRVRPSSLTPAFFKSLRTNLLLLSAAKLAPKQISFATAMAEEAGAKVGFIYDSVSESGEPMVHEEVDGVHFSRPMQMPASLLYPALKRIVDIVFSAMLLILLAPLFLLIAALIRFDSPGPALFVQKRAGRNGVLFDMYKFRSMYPSASRYELSPTSSRDIRITPIGRILRRTSLDELPQLFNVLLGNMSLVGPRPEMPFIVSGYDQIQRRRLAATPGITGLWQLSADRAFPIHCNLEYDLYYIQNRSLFTDIAILIHTLFFALSGGV